MKTNQQSQGQWKLETLLSELRQDFVSASNHADSFRRDFEFQKAIGKFRQLVSGLGEQELETLVGGIVESLEQENKRLESEISAENAQCEKISKGLKRVAAQRKEFNSRPGVIESRQQLEEARHRRRRGNSRTTGGSDVRGL